MITRLRGQLVARDVDALVLDVGGVGYRVLVPAGAFAQRIGDDVVVPRAPGAAPVEITDASAAVITPTDTPPSLTVSTVIADSPPSASASMATSVRDPGRSPVAVSSSDRSSTTRTGAAAARDSSIAAIASTPSDSFDPNPPPTWSAITSTRSGSKPVCAAASRRACSTACVDTHRRRRSRSDQSATAACGSKLVCTCTAVV